MFKTLKIAALALTASVVLGGAAEAGGYLKKVWITTPDNIFTNPPALVFEPKNGKYEVKQEAGSYDIPLHIHAERRLASRIVKWSLRESRTEQEFANNGFSEIDVKVVDKAIHYKAGWNQLKHFESVGRNICKQYGKPDEKVIKTNNDTRFVFVFKAEARTLDGYMDSETAAASVQVNIVCMPEPPVPFQVTDVDLTVDYKGSNAKCPLNVTLKAKFTTNKPGKNKFSFVLVRGDGAKQEINAETFGSGQQSIALWHKNYTFNKSETRKYMILVKGSPISTNWVPMKANCGEGIGGFAPAPKPNTD